MQTCHNYFCPRKLLKFIVKKINITRKSINNSNLERL